jgi:hypothetical protein
LKAALKVGDLLQPSRGVYQKPAKKPDSTSSTVPIGDVETVERAQPVDDVGDSLDFGDWDKNGECGNFERRHPDDFDDEEGF